MPIKKKPVKKVVIGPKAKLMKLAVTTLRTKAKKLGVSDVTKRTKENLAQSILLGQARKKRGTAAGKKATAKRAVSTARQTGTSNLARDLKRRALPPGRRVSSAGRAYTERRKNRSDMPGQFAGHSLGEKYNGWTNYWTWKYNLEILDAQFWAEQIEQGYYSNVYDLSKELKESADEVLEGAGLPDWAENWILSAFSDVNWYELAESLAEGTDLTE